MHKALTRTTTQCSSIRCPKELEIRFERCVEMHITGKRRIVFEFLSRDICTSHFSLDANLGPDCSVDTGLLQMKEITNLQLLARMPMMADLSITACKQRCIGGHIIQLFAHTYETRLIRARPDAEKRCSQKKFYPSSSALAFSEAISTAWGHW